MASAELAVLVRTLHVIAAAVLVGGPAIVAAAAWRARDVRDVLRAAEANEWLAWGALGLVVLSGVGNLGQFGDGAPATGTKWGLTLVLKLALVLALLLVSLARTLVVTRLTRADPPPPRAVPFLRAAYGGTVMVVTAVLVLAVRLAHG